MPRALAKPTLQSIAEEMAIQCMALAREDAARALENKRLAQRFLELSRGTATVEVAS